MFVKNSKKKNEVNIALKRRQCRVKQGKKGESNRKETDETTDTPAKEHHADQHAAVLAEQHMLRQEHKEAAHNTWKKTLKNWRTKKELLCWRKERVSQRNNTDKLLL